MDRVQLAEQQRSLGERLQAIKSEKQSLAPLVLQKDKTAQKRWGELDAEAALISREAELQELATLQAQKVAAEQAAQAARAERKAREDAAAKFASEILYCDDAIDALLIQLTRQLSARQQAIRALAATRVVSSFATNRMQQKFSPTAAADHFGLRPFISLEPILPAHRRSLSDVDAWLSKPLTLAEPTTPADDDAADHPQRTNGVDHV